ncbi:MAG: putative toxin-antitoxin system toxin component, PIN family [Thermoproteota archaeon]
MRVVLDTNVLVSAIFWKGNESPIIQLVEEGKLTLVTSLPILKELKKVLSYPKFPLDKEKVNEQVEYFFLAQLVSPTQKLNLIPQDPSYNKFLECALTGKADYIVSGDRHLLDLKEFQGIKIITGEELLTILNTKKE